MSVRHQDSCFDAQRQVACDGRIVEVQRRAHYFPMCPASCICDIDAPQLLTRHSVDAESLIGGAIGEGSARAFHLRFDPYANFLTLPLPICTICIIVCWCFPTDPPGSAVIFVSYNTRIAYFFLFQGSDLRSVFVYHLLSLELASQANQTTVCSRSPFDLALECKCSISAVEGLCLSFEMRN